MKRRDFLKKLGIVCGAVVACPIELLKGEPDPIVGVSGPGWWTVIDCSEEKFQKAFEKHKFKSSAKHLWMRGKDGAYAA